MYREPTEQNGCAGCLFLLLMLILTVAAVGIIKLSYHILFVW